MDITGSVMSLLKKMYEWVTDLGDKYPSQNSFARMVRVLLMVMGLVYVWLDMVGSLPSDVIFITVPTGLPGGKLSASLMTSLLVVALPSALKMGSPKILSHVLPQLDVFGVGVCWYPHSSEPSVFLPYEMQA